MKDIGLMMSFMDMVKSTMMIRISYKPVSITQISTYWEIPGTTTKATWFETQSKAEVEFYWPTGKYFRVIFTKTESRVSVNF